MTDLTVWFNSDLNPTAYTFLVYDRIQFFLMRKKFDLTVVQF